MATAYYAPGVYIEEPDRGTKPIEGVSTAVTAFIGFTEKAEEEIENQAPMTRSLLSEAKTITNWSQYQQHYGSFVDGAYLPYAVRGFFDNGGTRCYVISVKTLGEPTKAQALIDAKDRKSGKSIPALYVRAKKGGPKGKDIRVKIEPKAAPELKDAQTGALQEFNITVTGQKITTRTEQKVEKTQVEVEEAELDKSGKPILDENNSPKMKKVMKEQEKITQQEITEYTPVTKTISDVKLKHLPHWGSRNLDLANELERTFDKDLDDAGATKAKAVYKELDEAGVEVFKGIETNRPVYAELQTNEAGLFIEGSPFNVDNDKELIKAPEDQSLMAAAEASGDTFNMVRSQQFVGYGRKGISALEEKDDVNLLCAPDIMQLWDNGSDAGKTQVLSIQQAMVAHAERMDYRFAILDAPPITNVDSIRQYRLDAGFDPAHGHAALYYPWIKIEDPLNPGKTLKIPPSGHMAGIYARSDNQRGVHKAPANETVTGALDLTYNVTNGEQEMLNPIGVNCIRKFPGRGIKVWGARTLALTDPSWRYINVRRIFNYVEASIENSTQWVVFEPNDHVLWGKIRRDVNAFLRTLWLSGALFGTSPQEAYYVKCDEELNPVETRDLGYLFIEIGIAPVKPAEFVIFRISQWAGPGSDA